MRKKLLSMLALLCLTVASAWAEKTVEITSSDIREAVGTGEGPITTITKDGVTLSANIRATAIEGVPGSFSTSDGNFTNIVITAGYVEIYGEGWSGNTWTGNANSVSFSGLIEGASITIKFTLEMPSSLSVTANRADDGAYWSTFYSSGANYQASEGTQVFAVNLTGTTITMTEISDRIVKSDEGVVLKNSTTGSITMTRTDATPAGNFSSNSLTGTMSSITNPNYGQVYVLNQGTNGVGFYKLRETGSIGANKAYLTYSGAGAREFFLFEDDATGINEELRIKNEESSIYNLAGQRIQKMQKGINIVNGKKVIINK